MSDKHINLGERLASALRQHPLEWISLARTALSTLKYRYLCACAAKGSIIGFNTQIVNFSRVKIGRHALVQDNVYMRAGSNGSIVLGSHVAINSFAKLFGHGGISIGDNAQIGPGALLTTTTHDPEDSMQVVFRPIVIQDWAWIGANATILSGVTIGRHAVIGAGSVVTRSIPDHAIAVGAPAKVIGQVDLANAS